MKYIFISVIFLFAFAKAHSQATDLLRTEYTYFPQRNSDNSFRRFRVYVNVPLKIGEGEYIVPFFEYRNINLLIRDDVEFNKQDLDRFQSFEGAVGYTKPLKNDWRIGIRAGGLVASNFNRGEAISDDYFVTGSVYFIKSRTDREDGGKPWRLVLGIQYNTTAGRPFPLPYVNYYREFRPKWSYTIGAPKANIKWQFHEKHDIQLYARLDGFYSNIQNNRSVAGNLADNVSFTTLMVGPGYHWEIIDHVQFYTYAGYTLFNDIRLRDEDGDDVRTLNEDNTLYLRGGIKVKI